VCWCGARRRIARFSPPACPHRPQHACRFASLSRFHAAVSFPSGSRSQCDVLHTHAHCACAEACLAVASAQRNRNCRAFQTRCSTSGCALGGALERARAMVCTHIQTCRNVLPQATAVRNTRMVCGAQCRTGSTSWVLCASPNALARVRAVRDLNIHTLCVWIHAQYRRPTRVHVTAAHSKGLSITRQSKTGKYPPCYLKSFFRNQTPKDITI
jgi:hypothetical protein